MEVSVGQSSKVRAVREMLARLDPELIRQVYRGVGSRAYPPELMLGIVLFEILDKITSPAKWAQHAGTRAECRLLGKGITPSRTAWYDFRDRASRFIRQVHEQLLRRAIEAGEVDPVECCQDGTFTRAAATRHRLENLVSLSRRLRVLKRAVADDQAGREFDPQQAPRWVGQTPQGRARQLLWRRLAKRRLLERVAENREKPRKYQGDESQFRISVMDVDAVIGRDKEDVCGPLYNTQYLIAVGSEIIINYQVFAQCTDTGTLAPVVREAQRITGGQVRTVHTDKGYCSVLELRDARSLGVDLWAPVVERNNLGADGQRLFTAQDFKLNIEERTGRCPAGHALRWRSCGSKPRADGRTVIEHRFEQSATHCGPCPLAARCLKQGSRRRCVSRMEGQELLDSQAEKMNSTRGRASQRLRSQTAERLFADGKRHRNQNQQNGRGLSRVQAEVGLLVVAQNTLRLHNLRSRRKKPPP